MTEYLHKDFLINRSRFDAAMQYWKQRCDRLLELNGQADQWGPWLGIHRDRSEAVVEEGTIYSLYSRSQNKALNIEQYLPASGAIERSAYLDKYVESALVRPIDYLTISICPSRVTVGIARELIQRWFEEATTPREMGSVVSRLPTQ